MADIVALHPVPQRIVCYVCLHISTLKWLPSRMYECSYCGSVRYNPPNQLTQEHMSRLLYEAAGLTIGAVKQ